MGSSVHLRLVPAGNVRVEMKVVNSRFVASLARAATVADARGFVARINAEFADATHNVPAFLVGHPPAQIAHCSDNGEPSGTAGRPALAVLQGSGYGDAVVVVTRYFGGTKLGTGGLVRAYGEAVKEALAVVRPAAKVQVLNIGITAPYHMNDSLRRQLPLHGVETLDVDYGSAVTYIGRLLDRNMAGLQGTLRDLSGGEIQAVTLSSETEAIVPIDSPVLVTPQGA